MQKTATSTRRPATWLAAACLLFVTLAAKPADARTMEAGKFGLTGLIGPGFKLGKTLGGSPAYFILGGQGEYTLDPVFSVVTDLTIGFAGTFPLRWHVGGRARLADLGGPLSPYAQLQLAVGGLYNVLGANLTFVGARLGVGSDYFLTADTMVGALLGVDLGGTTGSRPAFYGTVDLLLYATYLF